MGITPEEAAAAKIRAEIDQARAAADEQERIRKVEEAIKKSMREEGR